MRLLALFHVAYEPVGVRLPLRSRVRPEGELERQIVRVDEWDAVTLHVLEEDLDLGEAERAQSFVDSFFFFFYK